MIEAAPFATPLPLGPFELSGEVGRGGMGRVFKGRHVLQGVDVAVKVLDSRRLPDPSFHRAFETEVRAVAGLDHPGIVMVFEYGRIPQGCADRSEGRIAAGSPYLVMELAGGGSLADVRRALTWRPLRSVLLALLDALAHAHARGVIHRDLKRSNVLLGAPTDPRPGLKLSDFGLAHRASELSGVRSFEAEFVGTPNYMAPEQCDARWRDYGPWTDLYALACLAWVLATGRVPFGGSAVEVIVAQRTAAPPPFHPVHPMPEGLQEWLLRLLAKDTWRRYCCAADAAKALRQLGLLENDDDSTLTVPAIADYRLVLGDVEMTTRIWTLSTTSPPPALPQSDPSSDSETSLRLQERREFPADWRSPSPARPPPQLLGAGLGLFGLRSLPFVARARQRDLLWGAFRDVHEQGSARAVLLRGRAGEGKSRLARWLCERARELGLARMMRSVHAAVPDERSGLAASVERWLSLKGLGRAEVVHRIGALQDRTGFRDAREIVALADLVRPRDLPQDGPGARQAMARRRHATVANLLERESAERALIYWIEDLHWSADSASFVSHLLDRQALTPARVLVVATCRPDEPGATAGEALAALAAHPSCDALDLEPLESGAQTELIGNLLALAPDVAQQVEARAGGNPLFAVQLVGDWVQRGLLKSGAAGFELLPAAGGDLPDDIHALWRRRVDRMIEQVGADAAEALELAAALGLRVDGREWGACSRPAGFVVPDGLARQLLQQGLATGREEAWSFAHGLLRESLERRARDGGRWVRWNRACADGLPLVRVRDTEHRTERIARHLFEAEAWHECVAPLMGASRTQRRRGACEAALDLVSRAEDALDRGGSGDADPRRVEAWLARADALEAMGRVPEAGRVAAEAVRWSRAHGQAEGVAAALLHIGVARMREHVFEEARRLFTEALQLNTERTDRRGIAASARLLARSQGALGDHEEARITGQGALQAADVLNDPVERAEALMVLGGIERRAGRLAVAEGMCAEAAAVFETSGRPLRLAEALLTVAEALRRRGEIEAAVGVLGRSRHLYAESGSLYAGTVEVNIALLDVERERYSDATRRLREALRVAEASGDEFVQLAGRLLLLPALAGQGRWGAMEQVLSQLEPGGSRIAGEDMAHAAEQAGDLAAKADRRSCAIRAWEIALIHWHGIGRRGRVARIQAALDELRSAVKVSS